VQRPSSLLSNADENISQVLGLLDVECLVQRAGGLDMERNSSSAYGIREQALLLIARVLQGKPKFIFPRPHERRARPCTSTICAEVADSIPYHLPRDL